MIIDIREIQIEGMSMGDIEQFLITFFPEETSQSKYLYNLPVESLDVLKNILWETKCKNCRDKEHIGLVDI